MVKQNRIKQYGLFLELANGCVVGYCEASFQMTWDYERVQLYDKKNAQQLLRQRYAITKADRIVQVNQEGLPKIKWVRAFLVRINSNNTIKIVAQDPEKIYMTEGKYAARNNPFHYRLLSRNPQ